MRCLIKSLNLIFLLCLLVLQGCFVYGKKESLSLDTVIKNKKSLDATLSSVDISNNLITITGLGFSNVTSVKLKGSGGVDTNLTIDSKSNSQIIASATSALSLLVGGTFDLIIGTAEAQATYTITLTLQNGAVVAANLASMGATSGQVLKYNGTAWAPASLASSQTYLGTWNANTNTPDISTLGSYQNGDYYIVSTAGTYNAIAYLAGDWAMFNGTAWEKIDNTSNTVASFNGRTGIVVLTPADYVSLKDGVTHKVTGSSLNDIADIDLVSLPPTNGQTLKWNTATSKWEPSDDLTSGGAGSVGATEVAAGSIANSHISATAAIAQSKIANLTTDLAAKEASLTAGTTAQYYRGDKSWQTLDTSVVPENTRLYFTEPRVLATAITAPTLTNSAIATGDSVQVAFGKAQAQIAAHTTSIGTKADTTNVAQTITAVALTGLTAPVAGSDATNKTYVDGAITANGVWTKSGTTISYSAGNVGIATTTPTSLLGIASAGGVSSGAVTMTAANGATTFTTSASVTLNAGDYLIPTTTTGQARSVTTTATGTSFTVSPAFSAAVAAQTYDVYKPFFNIAGTGVNVQGSTSNVGIGTATPSEKLEVNGSIRYTTGTPGFLKNTYAVLGRESDSLLHLAGNASFAGHTYINYSGGDIRTGYNVPGIFDINNGQFYTTASGNVGIGTTSPSSLLTIAAPTASSSGAVTMTAVNAATTFTTSATVTLNAGDYLIPTTTTGQARSIATTATGTNFSVTPAFTANVTAETYNVYKPSLNVAAGSLLLNGSTGYIGVGTVSPTAMLTVNGAMVSLQNSPTITGASPTWASSLSFLSSNAFSLSPSTAVANDSITLTFTGTPANGGSYMVSLKDPAVMTVVFAAASCGTIKYKPATSAANTITTSGTSGTLITMTTIYNGTNYDCYVTWASGYQ